MRVPSGFHAPLLCSFTLSLSRQNDLDKSFCPCLHSLCARWVKHCFCATSSNYPAERLRCSPRICHIWINLQRSLSSICSLAWVLRPMDMWRSALRKLLPLPDESDAATRLQQDQTTIMDNWPDNQSAWSRENVANQKSSAFFQEGSNLRAF